MSSEYFTPKEIIAVKKKFPDVPLMTVDIDQTRKNKNEKFPTYYIPFTFKHLSGKPSKLSLKLVKQIICSNAKIPHGVTEADAKDVRVVYRELTKDDLDKSEYPVEKHEALMKENAELIEAFDIIADEYEQVARDHVLPYNGKAFRFKKTRDINNFRQTHRNANDADYEIDAKDVADAKEDNREPNPQVDGGYVELPQSIFRVKIPADTISRKLGRTIKDKGFQPNVFDSRKAKKNNQYTAVAAKLKSKGKLVDLSIDNAKHFITFMSLTGGVIDFDSICVSQSGISIMNRFRDIHVWPHKQMLNPTMVDDDFEAMADMGTTGYDDVDIEEMEEKASSLITKSKKIRSRKPADDEDDDLGDVDDPDDPDDLGNNNEVDGSEEILDEIADEKEEEPADNDDASETEDQPLLPKDKRKKSPVKPVKPVKPKGTKMRPRKTKE